MRATNLTGCRVKSLSSIVGTKTDKLIFVDTAESCDSLFRIADSVISG